MDHLGFILAAYLATFAVVAGLVGWTVVDGRALKRRLAELEARGVRRRSGGGG